MKIKYRIIFVIIFLIWAAGIYYLATNLDKAVKQNIELRKINQHLKSENTFLQNERDWNKSDKRLLKNIN